MAEQTTGGAARSLALASGGAHSWTDGTRIDVRWTYEFLGGRIGAYRASAVTVTVAPPQNVPVAAVTIDVVERLLRSGVIAKQLTLSLNPEGESFSTTFDWESTTNNPEQELTVRIDTTVAEEPEMLLKDPLSRRYNFLLSFAD